jgi:riboflavin synthase alpha subunit
MGKAMFGVFRESERNFLVEFFATGATINLERRMQALKKLQG